jgi:hypothetical protein
MSFGASRQSQRICSHLVPMAEARRSKRVTNVRRERERWGVCAITIQRQQYRASTRPGRTVSFHRSRLQSPVPTSNPQPPLLEVGTISPAKKQAAPVGAPCLTLPPRQRCAVTATRRRPHRPPVCCTLPALLARLPVGTLHKVIQIEPFWWRLLRPPVHHDRQRGDDDDEGQ